MYRYYLSFFWHKAFWKNPLIIVLRIIRLISILLTNKTALLNIKCGESFFRVRATDFRKNQGGRSLLIYNNSYDGFLEYGHNFLEPTDIAIDGGANQGVYSCSIAKQIGSSGKIIAIEPLSEPVKMFKENIKLNNFKNIFIEKCALWKKNTSGKIYFNKDDYGQASVVNKSKLFEKTKLKKLDDIVTKYNLKEVNLIKLDLQGAEIFAIEGAEKTISKFKPILYLECDKISFDKVFKKLKKYNYKSFSLKYNGELEHIKKVNLETNILFLQDKHAAHYVSRYISRDHGKKIKNKLISLYDNYTKIRYIKNATKDINKKIDNNTLFKNSKSQLNQDIFVLKSLNFKKNGFFVEIGAADGINLSNTYLLEKQFNWNGILCEPSSIYKKIISTNRKAKIETNCIYNKNTKIKFVETAYPMLSTLEKFKIYDHHRGLRSKYKSYKYNKNTISVKNFLKKHKSPKNIDYLSVDTEGSEYLILKNFNFKKYKVKIVTVEHNFTKNRDKIFKLLKNNNFTRISAQTRHDDWYINNEIHNSL